MWDTCFNLTSHASLSAWSGPSAVSSVCSIALAGTNQHPSVLMLRDDVAVLFLDLLPSGGQVSVVVRDPARASSVAANLMTRAPLLFFDDDDDNNDGDGDDNDRMIAAGRSQTVCLDGASGSVDEKPSEGALPPAVEPFVGTRLSAWLPLQGKRVSSVCCNPAFGRRVWQACWSTLPSTAGFLLGWDGFCSHHSPCFYVALVERLTCVAASARYFVESGDRAIARGREGS